MTTQTSPRLGITLMAAAQSQPHLIVNAAIRILETVTNLVAISASIDTPPVSPNDGDVYVLANGTTGVWVGHEDALAISIAGSWFYVPAEEGWIVWVDDIAGRITYGVGSPAGWGTYTTGPTGPPAAIDVTFDDTGLGIIAADVQTAIADIVALFGAASGLATLDGSGRLTLSQRANMPVNTETGTTRTVSNTDRLDKTRCTNSGTVTITLDTNAGTALDIGFTATYFQAGTGQIVVSPAGGVTLNIPNGRSAKTRDRYSTLVVHKVGTDEWDIAGDLST